MNNRFTYARSDNRVRLEYFKLLIQSVSGSVYSGRGQIMSKFRLLSRVERTVRVCTYDIVRKHSYRMKLQLQLHNASYFTHHLSLLRFSKKIAINRSNTHSVLTKVKYFEVPLSSINYITGTTRATTATHHISSVQFSSVPFSSVHHQIHNYDPSHNDSQDARGSLLQIQEVQCASPPRRSSRFLTHIHQQSTATIELLGRRTPTRRT